MKKQIIFLASLIVLLSIAIFGTLISRRLSKTTFALHAIESSKTSEASASQIAVARTLTAMPTITPSPTLTPIPPTMAPYIFCDSLVQGTNRYLYPLPSFGYNRALTTSIKPKMEVKVIGKLPNLGWVKVRFGDVEGWMRNEYLEYVEPNCTPNSYPLSFLLGITSEGEVVVVDDTFVSNANSWTDSLGNTLSATILSGDAKLKVKTSGSELITTYALQPNSNLNAFHLNTSITINSSSNSSSFGFRFRDSGTNFYQAIITPSTCSLSVYQTDELLYQANLNPKACADRYYGVELSLDANYILDLKINGFEPITVALQDPNGLFVLGGIQLVANAIDLDWNYIVVTLPR